MPIASNNSTWTVCSCRAPSSRRPRPRKIKRRTRALGEEAKKAKEAEEKANADAAERAMTKLAESLRARAAAGEDFVKLQKEAFDAAGMKIESPTVNLPSVRRTGLQAGHAAVFDLKPGEVSPGDQRSGRTLHLQAEQQERDPARSGRERDSGQVARRSIARNDGQGE